MSRFKKITAIILVCVLVSAAISVNGSALDKEYITDNMKLYSDISGACYIVRSTGLYLDESSSAVFYSVNNDGTRTVIKELSAEETIAFSDCLPVSVPEDTFVKGGKYELKIVDPTEATPSDAAWTVTGVYSFTYDDLLGGKPIFYEFWHEVYEGQSIDLADYILTPAEYEGELSFTSTTYEDYFGESIIPGLRTYAETDGSVVTAVDDGRAYIEMLDEDGEFLDFCVVEVLEKEPETFFELIDSSAEKITEGLLDAVGNTGSNFVTALFLMVLPVVLPPVFLVSLIVNVFVLPY